MEFLSQELKELVSVLFLIAGQLLVGLALGEPETREDVGSRVAGGDLLAVEVLEHVIHGTAQAVLDRAVRILVSVSQIEIPQQRIVHEALEDDVHVACCSHIVDAPEATGTAWGFCCICRDESRVLFGRLGEQFVVFPFPG